MSDIATAPTVSSDRTSQPKPFEGSFIWYELITTDQDAAIDFYSKVIGWTSADFPSNDFRYSILSVGDRGVAGAMKIPDDALAQGGHPAWLGVVGVTDFDATVERITAAGGSVHKAPDNIPTVGRYAVVADPGGAIFELLSPEPMDKEPPPLAPNTPGTVGWHELYSGAGEKAAFDFYSRLFGWTTDTEMDMGDMGKYRIFARDGVQIGGMMDKPENVPVSNWTFYFNVDGLDAAVERVKANGGQVLMGPMEVPGGSWIIQGRDPQGAHFALVSAKR